MKILRKEIRVSAEIGLVFCALCISSTVNAVIFLSSAVETTATVQSYDVSTIVYQHERGRTGPSYIATSNVYLPSIVFNDASGNLHKVADGGASSFAYIGEHVPVLYNPSNPNISCIKSFSAIWGQSVLFLIVTIVIYIPSILAMIRPNKVDQSPYDTETFTTQRPLNTGYIGQRTPRKIKNIRLPRYRRATK